jgi:gluconate 2-dehydrogenase gamma chain
MTGFRRRDFLATTALVMLAQRSGHAEIIEGRAPWQPRTSNPPTPVTPGPWKYLTDAEGETVEAIVDRLIPADPETPGGKDAGCAVFIDRQLAGPYGSSEDLYTRGPFQKGTPQQGAQANLTPAKMYRRALSDLNRYCRDKYSGKTFSQLDDHLKDEVLTGLEKGSVTLLNNDGAAFFKQVLKNTQEGFFADPIYGGNRDMVAWKMIGFPGSHYDYRDWIDRHNERYPHPPVSMLGRAAWTPKKA